MTGQKAPSGLDFPVREAHMEQEVITKKIRREEAIITEFGAHLQPKARVEPGETFLVETQGAFSDKYPNPAVAPSTWRV